MFNLGDEVKLTTKTIGECDYSAFYDEIGIITDIERSMQIGRINTYITALFKNTYIKTTEEYFKLAKPQLLTITAIQERKEQLARDLFALIETYEKTTNTHISTLTLRTSRTRNALDIWVDRVTGVRLEVQL